MDIFERWLDFSGQYNEEFVKNILEHSCFLLAIPAMDYWFWQNFAAEILVTVLNLENYKENQKLFSMIFEWISQKLQE